MSPDIRRDLKRKVMDKSSMFGLDDIFSRCHVR